MTYFANMYAMLVGQDPGISNPEAVGIGTRDPRRDRPALYQKKQNKHGFGGGSLKSF